MNIKKLRLSLCLSQGKLAKECEVSLTTIRLWEQEVTKPSPENLIKLKKALKVK